MILDRPVGDLVEPLTGRVWPGGHRRPRPGPPAVVPRARRPAGRPRPRPSGEHARVPRRPARGVEPRRLGRAHGPASDRLRGGDAGAGGPPPALRCGSARPTRASRRRLAALGVDVVEAPAESGAPGADDAAFGAGSDACPSRPPRRRRPHPLHLGIDGEPEGCRPHPSLAPGALGDAPPAPRPRHVRAHALPAADPLRPRPHLQLPLPLARRARTSSSLPPFRRRPDHAARRAARRAPHHVHVLGARRSGAWRSRRRGRRAGRRCDASSAGRRHSRRPCGRTSARGRARATC